MPQSASRLALVLCGAALVSLTCAHPAPPPAAAPAAPAAAAPLAPAPAAGGELSLPGARSLAPVERSEPLAGKLIARHVDWGYETIVIGVAGACLAGANVWVEQRDGLPRPWSGLGFGDGETPRTLLVRRSAEAVTEGNRVHVFTEPSSCNGYHGEHLVMSLPDTSGAPSDVKALEMWARGLAAATGSGAWAGFARSRLEEIYFPKPPQPKALELRAGGPVADKPAKAGKNAKPRPAQAAVPAAPRRGPLVTTPRRNPNELARLMDTTTGMTSLQETLQQDRQLAIDARAEAASVPLGELQGPPSREYPWVEMMAALGRPVPDEPLAHAAPADFYFLRFRSLPDLLRVVDELDTWITPAGQVMSGQLEDHELAPRIEAELGLGRGPLTRTLGPSVVTDLAVVGSDPYVREGSDVTLIFRLKVPAAFDTALAATMAGHAARHGGVTASTYDIVDASSGEKTMVTLTRSADGAVRQHRATVGGFHLVSNSRAGLLRVIHAIKGKTPRLSEEPDFRYMLARDAGVRADVLAFMSDRFVSAVVGPRQKILEARRQVALHELLAPGYAALLHGWVYGRAPQSVEELTASGLLRASELRHADGEAIVWRPGQPARSSWGTPRALTPLIDLTVPEKVTTLERDAYRFFIEGYQRHWRTYIDPVAVRLALEGGAGGPLRIDLRVLPVVEGTDYDELSRTVGSARVATPALERGLRGVLGIGENAELRRLLRKGAREMPFGRRLELDWLGEWAVLGMEDHSQPVQMLLDTELGDQKHRFPDEERRRSRDRETDFLNQLVELPVWGGVALRSSAPAAIFLTALRVELEHAAPGVIDWKEAGKHAGVPFVAIRAGQAGREMGSGELGALLDRLALYYAFCPDSLILSLNEQTLRRRIDECKTGTGPKAVPAGTPGGKQDAQWVMDLGMQRGGPLWRGLGWLLAQMPLEGAEGAVAAAEAVLRGLPGLTGPAARTAALDVLGFAPITAEGRDFTFGREGIADPLRGSQHAPRRPALPVDGSPAARLLDQLQQARSEIAFDEEAGTAKPPLRSLHVVLRLRGAKD